MKPGDKVSSKDWGNVSVLKQDSKLYYVEGIHEIARFWRTASGTLEQIQRQYVSY